MKFQAKFTENDTEDYRKWLSFYPQRNANGFTFKVSPYWYFDPRPMIITNVTSIVALLLPFFSLWLLPFSILFMFYSWGEIFIRLPLNSGKGNTAEYPNYGVMFYSIDGEFPAEIWLKWGEKSKTIYMPWSLQWYSTSLLLADGSWEVEKKGDKKNFFEEEWQEKAWMNHYMYEYILKSGKSQMATATVTVERRQWRYRWLYFTSLFAYNRKTIEVKFNREMGERAGEWKGGTVGCNYEMEKGETAHQALRRMERERKFN